MNKDYNIFPVGDRPPFKYAVVHQPTGEWIGDLHYDRSGAEAFISRLVARDEAEHELDDLGYAHRPPEPVQDPKRRDDAVQPTEARR